MSSTTSSTTTTATPKGSLTISNIGTGMSSKSIGKGAMLTVKCVKDKLTGQIQLSDGTFSFNRQFAPQLRKLNDVILKADYKARSDVTANGVLDVGSKKYTVGATWDGKVLDKKSTIKGWYSTRDNLAYGEVTVNVDSKQKAFVAFNQQKLISAKYTVVRGRVTAEPSYSFLKSSPAVAVTTKLDNKDTIKLTHDLKSESTAVEYVHGPLKAILSTKFGKSFKAPTKPSLALTLEKVYTL